MTNKPNREEVIFYRALVLGPGEDQSAYLDEACEGDAALRREVEDLLEAHQDPVSLLEGALIEKVGASTEAEDQNGLVDLTEQPGDSIGLYKLLQKIGEGGFGSVWMAEQTDPINMRVALKIIKLGMDTKEVIARFHAERQALAMMDHPNIAKILNAGSTETGRPFFVMDLVKGIPITRFCDERKLGTRARLELFLDVCGAVNHAHQKGIIHRDLKPTNILVTLMGSKPVPKVIDFGIAKAIHTKLTEQTLFTRFEQFVGTPVYMAPEQAALSGLDIDTRSDVYSLGILLYELITGKLPFDPETLRHMNYDELRDLIRRKEPPKPSNRLGTLAEDERTEVAETHQADPKRLHKLVRNDLDWIVMKAIEKDRVDRYETANAFAMDIRRYLDDLPTVAGKPNLLSKSVKFARRNTRLCAAVTAIALSLVAGTLVSVWQMYEARGHAAVAEENANAARTAALLAKEAAARADIEAQNAKDAKADLEREKDFFGGHAESATFIMPRLEPLPNFTSEPVILRFGIRASDPAREVHEDVKWILQPLRARLEYNLQRTVVVKIVVFRDYQKLIDEIGSPKGTVDFMRSGGNPYILAKNKYPELVLLARHDSEDDEAGRILVSPEFTSIGIKSWTDLKSLIGRRREDNGGKIVVAFGSPFSGSGRIRAQEVLQRNGFTADVVDWKYCGTHENVGKALLEGDADVGGLKFSTYKKCFGPEGDLPGAANIIEFYSYREAPGEEPRKGKPWVARKGLDDVNGLNLSEALQRSLVELDQHYLQFWLDKDPGDEDDYHKVLPADYPLPIRETSPDFYEPIERIRENARGFFGPLPERIVYGNRPEFIECAVARSTVDIVSFFTVGFSLCTVGFCSIRDHNELAHCVGWSKALSSTHRLVPRL